MKLVFSDQVVRVLTKLEAAPFFVPEKGVYLIQISAVSRSENQIGGSDDEDLRVEIDGRAFPLLSNPTRLFDSPAAFSGGATKGLSKTVFFLMWLEFGPHQIELFPDIAATLKSVDVFHIGQEPKLSSLNLTERYQAEDGDGRDWLTFVLVDTSLDSFWLELTLKRRFRDSDDVKVILDDTVKKNHAKIHQKLWFFIASLIGGEKQNYTFETQLPLGLHYLELWADRSPTLETIKFIDLFFKNPITIQEKIIFRANQYGLQSNFMLRVAKRESQFDPLAISPAGAQGLFQLTDITIRQIHQLGLELTDPYDIDQNILGGCLYFHWLFERYKDQPDQLKKTLAAWNWGLSHIPVEGKLNTEDLPSETQNFINDVLADYDF